MRKATKFISLFFQSKFRLNNFMLLLGVFLAIFISFYIYTYSSTKSAIESDFLKNEKYQASITANIIDNGLVDVKSINALIKTDPLFHMYCVDGYAPENVITNFYSRIQELLNAYVNSNSIIDSIYIYSESSNYVMTKDGQIHLNDFQDLNWMSYIDKATDNKTIIFPRAIRGVYPYVLCMMDIVDIQGHKAALVTNVNLSCNSYLNSNVEEQQKIYIVNNDSEIIYRQMQQDVVESVSIIPELVDFKPDIPVKSNLFNIENKMYAYTQIASNYYDWNYIHVTHLPNYSEQMTLQKLVLNVLLLMFLITAAIVAFVLAARSSKPIETIIGFFNEPNETTILAQVRDKTHEEITFIAQKLAGIMHTNQRLSDELNKQFILLNETKLVALQSQINPHFLFNTLNLIHICEIETLGYDHPAPKITLKLAKLLRYALESTNMTTIDRELKYVGVYSEILNHRFGDKLQINIVSSNEIADSKIPKLLIQPLIENAITHGSVQNMPDIFIVNILCEKEIQEKSESIKITISDNGCGMTNDALEFVRNIIENYSTIDSGKHIGIKNIVTRMSIIYGNRFKLNVDSNINKGTVFTLLFPDE